MIGISIIVPVYNAEEYLDKCLSSILSQDFHSYEVILVDDGSTDASPLICDRYSATDPRFRTIHKSNGGVSSARNSGIRLAKGEYVMFLDSDDRLTPSALRELYTQASGADFVIGGFSILIDRALSTVISPSQTRLYNEDELSQFWDESLGRTSRSLDSPWCKLYKRSLLKSSRLFFAENLSYAEDKLFVYNYLLACRSVATVSSVVYEYIVRSGSLGSDMVSDSHLKQLRTFLPLYSDVLLKLSARFSGSTKLQRQYHRDLIGCYVCRALNIFARRRTPLLTEEYISFLYGLMDADRQIGVFSLRVGQIPNILLYKIGKPSFSCSLYAFVSRLISVFHA